MSVFTEIRGKNWDHRVQPFKVILKIVESNTDRSGIYDLRLMIRSNYGPISYSCRGKRRFWSI